MKFGILCRRSARLAMSEPTSGENKSWPAVDVLSAHRLEGRYVVSTARICVCRSQSLGKLSSPAADLSLSGFSNSALFFLPVVLSRARARLNAWYQMEEVARAKPPGVKPTADDRAAFARENPETGRELEALIANQRWALASGVVGSIGFGAHSLRHGGSAVFGLVGGILGGLVSGSVADNVRFGVVLWGGRVSVCCRRCILLT